MIGKLNGTVIFEDEVLAATLMTLVGMFLYFFLAIITETINTLKISTLNEISSTYQISYVIVLSLLSSGSYPYSIFNSLMF